MKTGIKQSIKTEFEIYPNPSHSGILYIKGATDKRIDLEVKDCLGKTLFLLEKMEMNQAIDLSKYGTGTFILTVRDEDKWINYKVVIL